MVADNNGESYMIQYPPSTTAGLQMWFQALDWDSGQLSNGVALTIQ